MEKYRHRLREIAEDQHGYVTTAQARTIGIPSVELAKLAHRGGVTNVGYGVYRFNDIPLTQYSQFMEAVLLVGGDAVIAGDSVLAMHNLALVNPRKITVATTRRVRRNLPGYIKVVHERERIGATTAYEGVPSFTVAEALKTSERIVMTERLLYGAKVARREGLITGREEKTQKERLRRRRLARVQ